MNEWEYYKDFIGDLSMLNNTENWKNLFSRHGEYGENILN